ncbi:cobaltochelatase subunit CobN [Zavarzinia sp. CC-PAN008]|uniref:cobaltochelatase subunit CobN n=1 Tax=Zavarzinia sp. CC-PAN008 TaxID=3243332 RepID=UPI003F7421B9
MHLLAVQAGAIDDGSAAVDLGQSPGDIVVLSAADSDLTCLAFAAADLPPDFPTIRLANFLKLQHPYSVDLYVEQVVAKARLVVLRLLGGRNYWSYGLAEVARTCREQGILLAVIPGDDGLEADMIAGSTVPVAVAERMLAFLRQGGRANARNFLLHAADLIGRPAAEAWRAPQPVLDAGLYLPAQAEATLEEVRATWAEGAPVAWVIFYRALLSAGTTEAVDALVQGLRDAGLNPLALHVRSLKDPFAQGLLRDLMGRAAPDIVLNATSFATASPGTDAPGVLDAADCPVLQVVFAASGEAAWEADARGLSARDLAMNVALPEVDGRLVTRAIAFKAEARFDTRTEVAVVAPRVRPDRVAFVAQLAAGWADLRRTPAAQRRAALVLANYPNRDARLGNGVGLDTPASTAAILAALAAEGWQVDGAPADGAALVAQLLAGPTNAAGPRQGGQVLPLADYARTLAGLPQALREALAARWGTPEQDPFFDPAVQGFRLGIHVLGHVVVGVQPARGYNIDPKATYHDPALVPPHGYVAFYAWLRQVFGAQAIVHVGKHGNVEWLPGKALALSAACWPEAVLGPLPQLYPFIVNDPGEGTQAKRRIGAAIVDHLTPPLTRAESYGPLRALEALVDEYYLAAGMDPRRLERLRVEILDLARGQGLDVDGGLDSGDAETDLARLDAYLCDLKEMQIRDGLHVFTQSPAGRQRTDLLVALARLPRRTGQGADASLIRALAADLGFAGFDPLDCPMAAGWTGTRPAALAGVTDDPWRSAGDTVERLELLAARLVEGTVGADPAWTATAAVLAGIAGDLGPRVDRCGGAERAGLLAGLAGRFVAPGASGAPTRGRPEVLPTGRNFYSVDTRAVPTPTAWALGWASAQLLVDEHFQREGAYPRAIALSAWGTANMRTGGDDIAQALALMGVRPTWDWGTGRVTGFEVLPLVELGRPRVDVTIRISGFFRDAFPDQINLLDSAARAVMALDEDAADNPLAGRDGARVYGAKPGAYGAGLQALIDERIWQTQGDLAEAFLTWGAYAYGQGREGEADRAGLEARLGAVDAIVQNQDNREHDLLDSDDYYQFEGGLAAAATALTGTRPAIYHNDHSRPERPVIRTLEAEIGRVVRARMVNPKWLEGVMRHGYKGAFEMAASVDYLFAFAATTGAVANHHFDLVHAAYLEDEAVRAFLAQTNPHALADIAARLDEAVQRGLWRPRSNSAGELLARLSVKEERA